MLPFRCLREVIGGAKLEKADLEVLRVAGNAKGVAKNLAASGLN